MASPKPPIPPVTSATRRIVSIAVPSATLATVVSRPRSLLAHELRRANHLVVPADREHEALSDGANFHSFFFQFQC
jgi:hypothetical protein